MPSSQPILVQIARELGYLSIPDEVFVGLKQLPHLPPEQVCIISTGSQGEPPQRFMSPAMPARKSSS